MAYTWSWDIEPPSSVVVGEPFEWRLEACGTGPGGGTVTVDGYTAAQISLNLAGDFCVVVASPGDESDSGSLDTAPFYEFGSGNTLTFTETGTYPISGPGGVSKTITVEQPPFDPSLVDVACPDVDAPTTVNPGDSVTFTATVSNENSVPASATVEFTFGGATQSTTVTAPANGDTNATVSFTPGESTDYTYGVGVASATQG